MGHVVGSPPARHVRVRSARLVPPPPVNKKLARGAELCSGYWTDGRTVGRLPFVDTHTLVSSRRRRGATGCRLPAAAAATEVNTGIIAWTRKVFLLLGIVLDPGKRGICLVVLYLIRLGTSVRGSCSGTARGWGSMRKGVGVWISPLFLFFLDDRRLLLCARRSSIAPDFRPGSPRIHHRAAICGSCRFLFFSKSELYLLFFFFFPSRRGSSFSPLD